MASKALKSKIRQALKTGNFSDDEDLVDVSDGEDGSIHVVVISRKFDGKRFQEKRELIWDDLMAKLTQKEWSQVTLAVPCSPEEIKALA